MRFRYKARDSYTLLTDGLEPVEQSLIDMLYEVGNLDPPNPVKADGRWRTVTKADDDGNKTVKGLYSLDAATGRGMFISLTDNCPDIIIKPKTDKTVTMGKTINVIGARTAAKRRNMKLKNADTMIQNLRESCEDAYGDHGFFASCGLYHSFGAMQTKDGDLIFPMFSASGVIGAAMRITPEGGKSYIKGSKALGSFSVIGNSQPEFLTRDIEDALWIQDFSGKTCLAAGTDKNFKEVAELFPGVAIVTSNNPKSHMTAEVCHELFGNPVIRFSNPDKKIKNICDYAMNGGNLEEILKIPGHKKSFDLMRNAVLNFVALRWLIYNWLPGENTVEMVFGPSGQYKTYTVLDMLFKVSFGFPDWFGNYINKGKVVYFAGEGFYAVKERTKALLKKHNIPAQRLHDNLIYVDQSFALDNPAVVDSVIDTLETDFFGFRPKVIAMDTFNYYVEGDENAQQSINKFSHGIKRLATRYNCCILLVHHTKKGNDLEFRGGSGLKGILDLMIRVTAKGKEITVAQVKNRAESTEDIPALHLEPETITLDDVLDSKTGEPRTNVTLIQADGNTDDEENCGDDSPEDDDKLDEGKAFVYQACLKKGVVDTVTKTAYISWEELYNYGCEIWKDIKPKSVKQRLNANEEDRMLGRLIANGIITEDTVEPRTYSVTDPTLLGRIINTRKAESIVPEESEDEGWNDSDSYENWESDEEEPDYD